MNTLEFLSWLIRWIELVLITKKQNVLLPSIHVLSECLVTINTCGLWLCMVGEYFILNIYVLTAYPLILFWTIWTIINVKFGYIPIHALIICSWRMIVPEWLCLSIMLVSIIFSCFLWLRPSHIWIFTRILFGHSQMYTLINLSQMLW